MRTTLMTRKNKLPVKLACDASSYGIGAVLSHVFPNGSERPIAYASRTLNQHEKMYSQLDKEGLSTIFGVQKFTQYLYGRHFTLTTDNKALSRIIHPNTAIPNIAAARLVRWSVILAAYDYEIELKPTQKHLNADMLSRLPVSAASNNYLPNSINTMQIDFLPITAQKIRLATAQDPTLSRVIRYLSQDMWPQDISSDLKPYFDKRLELSLENGILLWGLRVVIPEKFKLDIMNELHDQHPGIVRMKALSRIHVWFPNIDKAIEEKVNTCNDCKKVSRNPPKTFIHPWNWPTQPFDRVHIDFMGPFYGKNYLLLVDSYSKWMEVDIIPVTSSFKTIEILRRWFSQFGLPYQLVSDNGPQFTSTEFEHFMKSNGVKHIFTSSYHPSSNGGAERFVQTIKNGLRTANIQTGNSEQKLRNFLLAYRTTPSSTTGQTPSELFVGRRIRTRLDLLKPDLKQRMENQRAQMEFSNRNQRQTPRTFCGGDNVLVRNLTNGPKWLSGIIKQQIAPLTYMIQLGNRMIKRHIDHIISSNENVRIEKQKPDDWSYNFDGNKNKLNADLPVTVKQDQDGKRYPSRNRNTITRYGFE